MQQLTQEEVHSLFLDGEMPVQSIPRAEFSEMKSLVEVVFRAGAAPSKGKARKLIQQGGIYLNHTRVKDISYAVGEQDLLQGGVCVVRAGKKSNFVLHVKDE